MNPEAPPTSPLPVVLLMLGFAMLAPYVVLVVRASLDAKALVSVLARIFTAGDVDRALKLTRAAPHMPLLAAVGDVLLACRNGLQPADDPAGYRTSSADSFDTQFAMLRARYNATFARAIRPVVYARWFSLIGAFAVFAAPPLALVIAWDAPSPMWVCGAAPLCLVALAYTATHEWRLRRDRDELFDQLRSNFETLLRTGAPQTARVRRVDDTV
jgi:hypothetical protein